MPGKAIIFSAPSGSGKTTIVHHLLNKNPDLGFSISAATRDKRGRKEENGKDYYFLAPEEFKHKIDADEFVEWEEVYAGNFYGTTLNAGPGLPGFPCLAVFIERPQAGANWRWGHCSNRSLVQAGLRLHTWMLPRAGAPTLSGFIMFGSDTVSKMPGPR